jgi:hypothetical protein
VDEEERRPEQGEQVRPAAQRGQERAVAARPPVAAEPLVAAELVEQEQVEQEQAALQERARPEELRERVEPEASREREAPLDREGAPEPAKGAAPTQEESPTHHPPTALAAELEVALMARAMEPAEQVARATPEAVSSGPTR